MIDQLVLKKLRELPRLLVLDAPYEGWISNNNILDSFPGQTLRNVGLVFISLAHSLHIV